MEDYIIKGLTYLLIALTNVVVGYVILFLRKHKVIKELEAHREIVTIGVTAVQQAYSHMDGNEKFKLAKQWITKTAASKGLKIDEKQIDFLIDSVVKEAKIEFGKAWTE
ncbi:phage holin [Bacillus infantis]|uniref:phage holin n=1 Tax=Bacillus infantis TaxID=324767 RepID=UPI00209EFB0D|nr:phage holin [Bacillus infantis]MCP1159469.1 phage holin [Bacillus infantis]